MFRLVTALVLFAASARAAAPADADAILSQLATIRLDRTRVLSVRDITLVRDALSISLNRGALVFTEPVEGRVTGAVFIGSGDLLVIPPDRAERQQLYRFTKSALLNEHFETALLRFSDDSHAEILRQHAQHAVEDVDADDVEELLRWESELQRRAEYLNVQLLADMIGSAKRPFFLAQIEGSQFGWFDAVYDERRAEEVFVQQRTVLSDAPLVWTSFNKRSEIADRAALAHEDKSLYDIVTGSADGLTMGLLLKADGERVLEFPALTAKVARVAMEGGPDLFFNQHKDGFTLVLPEPSKSGQHMMLNIEYSAETTEGARIQSTLRPNGVGPASYRDQWIVDGLAVYAATAGNARAALDSARAALLERSPEGGTYESLGPLSVGVRLAQPRTTLGYANVLANKGLWVVHMLKHVLESSGGNAAFAGLLADISGQFRGKTISTYEFKGLAEKHAGKSLDWFFDSWVFDSGIPEYKVDYKLEQVGAGFLVSGTIEQSGVPATFEMSVPVYGDEVFLGLVDVSADGGTFQFMTPTRPQQVTLDPMGVVLKR